MSDISNIISGVYAASKRVCRVAYTLNNAQPVACTIIGEQPLFYMDFDEASFEDDDLFMLDGSDIGVLEQEIRSLKDEIDAYDKFSCEPAQSTQERVGEFFDNSDFITKPSKKKAMQAITVEKLKDTLSQSRLAAAYLACADEYGIDIRFSHHVETSSYDRKHGSILLNPALSAEDLTLLCARELRVHWQHRQGTLLHPLLFQADSAILVNRLQVADLNVSMIRVAWELQLSGHKQVWERVEDSPLADLGRAFAREAYLDFRTINNGAASAAVFEAWFLSERCRHQDRQIIQDMLADNHGQVFDLEQIMEAVTPELIGALGTMPYGKNYLAEHAMTILQDPIFTDVRDRSNSNFLWFIKFERSFKETEQELQISEESDESGVLPGSKTQDDYNEAQARADIIQLFGSSEGQNSRSGKLLSAEKHEGSADNVVYLRRFPADHSS